MIAAIETVLTAVAMATVGALAAMLFT